MDIMTIVGFTIGISCMYYVMHVSGIAGIFLNLDAFLLVIGGTFSATLISNPWGQVKRLPNAFRMIFFPQKSQNPSELIGTLVRLAEVARRGDYDMLDREIASLDDRFLIHGIRQMINGLPPELIRETLEKEITFIRWRHQQVINTFKTMGTYAPIFGLLGTLIGVVQVLRNLTDPTSLGPAMAVAVTATFYGIFCTNFIFLPIAGKLSAHSDAEMLLKEVTIEGVLAIQAREVPALVSLKLQAYLSHHLRTGSLARE